MSEDVRVVPLERHTDDRGYLYEIIHRTDDFLPAFGQTYVVCSPTRGTIRGLHRHDVLWDYFCVVKGSGKFVVAEAPEEELRAAEASGESYGGGCVQTFVLSERSPCLLVIPPGHWHGWVALEDETIVLATGSEVYDRESPDEVRVSPGVFGDVWTVKGR